MRFTFRYVFLALGFVFSTVFLVISCDSQEKDKSIKVSEKKPPNIIFIMADDMATQAISAYGGIYKDIAPTPHMDQLADQGMIFQDLLCTNAICGPSRSGILTGDQSTLNGYYKNERGGIFDASKWTFPQEFQKIRESLDERYREIYQEEIEESIAQLSDEEIAMSIFVFDEEFGEREYLFFERKIQKSLDHLELSVLEEQSKKIQEEIRKEHILNPGSIPKELMRKSSDIRKKIDSIKNRINAV